MRGLNMATITQTESRTKTSLTHGPTTPTITTHTHTRINSLTGARLTAAIIRDFVDALDTVNAPGKTFITACRGQTGHITQLVAEWTETNTPPTETEPA